jgi:hypothetical protein
VWKGSPERLNVVEAETVPVVEGHLSAVVRQNGDAPPGSWIASRTVCGTRAAGGGESGTSEGRRVMGTLEERIQRAYRLLQTIHSAATAEIVDDDLDDVLEAIADTAQEAATELEPLTLLPDAIANWVPPSEKGGA